jgi:hypothetical protein
MSGPWEQYQKPTGPWDKYKAPVSSTSAPPVNRGPAYDDPTKSAWATAGSFVPEMATPALRIANKVAQVPVQMGEYVGGALGTITEAMTGGAIQLLHPELQTTRQLETAHPILMGGSQAIGEVAGDLAGNPTNWPLMGSGSARPLLRKLITRGFTASMAKGTYDSVQELYNNWDKMSPKDRAELGTKAGISAAMTAITAKHWHEAPAPENIPIAASGKTESEIKAQVSTSSPRTGLDSKPELTYDQIKARIAEIEARTAKPKAAPEPAKVTPAVEEAVASNKRIATYIAKTDAVRAEIKAKAQAPEATPVEAAKPEPPKAPTPEQELASLRAQRAQELTDLKAMVAERRAQNPEVAKAFDTLINKPAPPEGATRLEVKQAEMKAKNDVINSKQAEAEQFIREHRRQQATEATRLQQENDALRKASSSPEVGGVPATPEAAKPAAEPVPPAKEASRSGEPVRPAAQPEVGSEPRSLRGDLGERPPAATKPAPRDFAKEMEVFKQRVDKWQEDHPGVAKNQAQQIVAEQMRKERGALGGSPDDPQARREAKINEWLNQLKDEKTPPSVLDNAYKMLGAYGLSHDDIIQRMAGGADFAKSPIEERLGPNPELDKKADSMIGGLMNTVDRTMAKYPGAGVAGDVEKNEIRNTSKTTEEYMARIQALEEGRAKGNPSISGVKDPAQEELDRMFKLRDDRIRDKERGSLSFKRLTDEERKSANPLRRLADALDRVAGFIEHGNMSPEEAAREQQARNIIRGAAAEKARSHLEVMEALKGAIERHDSPTNERENFIQFMDAGEGKEGAKFLRPEDQALANVLHEMFDEKWEKVKEVKGLEGDGIENYLAHIWEKSGKAGQLLQGILTGRKPLEGSARFLKNRFYQYASSGVEHGLNPVTWNPIRLQLAALFDTDRFLMAHDIKDQFKDAGLVQWKKLSEYKDVPPGWQRLDDKIFQPKIVGDGALKEYGTYYAPAEVAKIFNRYLSPGLGGNPVFRNFRNYGNTLNMINLGISGYHGTMISLVSATSDLALGLQKVMNYGDIGGVKDMLRGTIGTFMLRSAARDYNLGRSIQGEALDPTGNPELQKYVDAITKGGGRFKQDPFYSNMMAERKGFVNWLRLAPQGKFMQMAQNGVRALSGPIMEKFVPRVKLGAAARMMETKLADLQKNGITDENTVATEMGKIWDSIDNRAGQMVYDNLFWNNAAKDLAFTAVRAVGWDLGSVREYGGGVAIDLPRQLAKGLRGERPELTSRLAFTIATPITVGLVGGMLHYYMTGKAPTKTEDYFFPGPDGNKVSFPSYMKDYFSFKDHPMKTVVNKLHPTWGQLSDLYSNADFYGTEIYHPGDPNLKKGWDIMKWYGKSFVPLSFKGIETRIERGEPVSSATSGFAGFMPAPSSVGQTDAEKLAFELSTREWKKGPRTSADAERYQLVQKFQRQVGAGQKIDMQELTRAWQDKKIQDTDIAKIYSSYNVPKLQREFKELSLPDALAVMREAKPEERVQLKPLLLQKYGQLERYPLDQQQAYDREVRAYFK